MPASAGTQDLGLLYGRARATLACGHIIMQTTAGLLPPPLGSLLCALLCEVSHHNRHMHWPRGSASPPSCCTRLGPTVASRFRYAGSLGRANEDCCLLVGTSTGFLYLVALDGRVLQRQRLHNRPLTSIRCRAAGMGIDPLDPLEDITIMADNAFMRLRAIELLSVLRGHRVGSWTAADSPVLSIDKWRLPRSVGLPPMYRGCESGAETTFRSQNECFHLISGFGAGWAPHGCFLRRH